MVRYVAGFLMNETKVLLVRKNHPARLAGQLTGIGGKVEPGETAYDAMEREFREETGFSHIILWEYFLTLRGRYALDDDKVDDFEVLFYKGNMRHVGISKRAWKNDVGEILSIQQIASVLEKPGELGVMPNVTWILPMARSFALGERAATFTVTEEYK